MNLYKIKDWDRRYENNRTRELKRMEWVPIPNSHDGEGYTLTATQKNGAELLGAWLVILQVASRCGKRGTLLRDTAVPHDSSSIARISRLPEPIIAMALKWFASHEVQWLELVEQEGQLELVAQSCENPAPACENPASGCLEGKGREGKRNKRAVAQIFVPPSPEEVEAYSVSVGYPLNGQEWCDKYQQKGWMVGKNKMKDWRAAVRNWKQSGWKTGTNAISRSEEDERDRRDRAGYRIV